MTDSARRRISKWDVKEDPPVEVGIRECDSFKVKELHGSSNIDRNQLPELSGPKSIHEASSEVDKNMTYWSKKDDSSYRSSKVYSQRLQSPQDFDLETVYKDGSKKSYWEQESINQDIVKDAYGNGGTDGRGAAINRTHSSSMSPGLDAWRQRSRSASPRGGWNRSSRKRSRTRSRSRSRSPKAVKHGYERWAERGKMAGGSAPPCRDFAVGRCRRGSQCRYFHDDAGRRHYDSSYNADARESRSERSKYSGYESKQNFGNPREQSDCSRSKPSERHGSHYDDSDWEKPGQHGNIKSTERCYDFTKGRCHRGASCRYNHHEASFQSERSMRDESRERTHERNDPDVSFGRRLEPRRVSENPCKYFAEGRCRRGEDCRFSHQGAPQSHAEDRAPDDRWGYNHDIQSRNDSLWSDQPTILDPTNTSQQASESDVAKFAVPFSMDKEDSGRKHQDQYFDNIEDNQVPYQKDPSSQKQDASEETAGQHEQLPVNSTQMVANITTVQQYSGIMGGSDPVTTNDMGSQPKTNSVNLLSNEQNFGQMGQIHKMVPQPPGQMFSPNVPALAFNSQMQQVNHLVHPIGQSQFIVHQSPSSTQNFALSAQGQPVLSSHVGPIQQGYNLGGQVLQNIPPHLHNGQGQQHVAFGGQQNTPPPQIAISQKNFDLSAQTQQSIPILEGMIQQNVSISGQSQQSLPSQNGEGGQIVQSLALGAQNQYDTNQTPSNLQNLKSADESLQGSDILETKPSGSSSGTLITHKVVTSEQAARITDLSASLAKFFGTTDLNAPIGLQSSQAVLNSSTSRPSTEAPSGQPNPGPWIQHHESKSDGLGLVNSDISKLPPVFSLVSAEPKGLHMEESLTGVRNLIPLSVADGTNNENSANSIKLEGKPQHESQLSNESKEVNEAETFHSKKDLAAPSEDGVADVQADGENKKSKEAKGVKMFKCALIEFVKDILKPAWKEGHLSKEAHKTIVKKVVEKVTGAMQGPNVPQTQEKIDAYLSYSKAKLSKLVQAYVEKYVKS